MAPFDPSLHSEDRVVGPGFHGEVHALVREVPEGSVTTYGDLAEVLGSRSVARHVGFALAALPKGTDVPWWRVVAAGGRLSQAPLAAKKQARLLRAEGQVISGQRVRSFEERRHQWD